MFLVSLNLGNSIILIENKAMVDAHALKAWVSDLLVIRRWFPRPNETTSSERYPAFLINVTEFDEMLH